MWWSFLLGATWIDGGEALIFGEGLGPAPWNEIRPKKYFFPGIPVVQLWRDSYKSSYAIPLGRFAPCFFAMSYFYPVKFLPR